MTEEAVVAELTTFIRERFLDGDRDNELTDTTPLLQWGILDSLSTAVLLKFIRHEMGVTVSPSKVDAKNFRDIRSIAAVVCQSPSAASEVPGGVAGS
jgi:clorobiocin biosynthesis protein CloN5